MYICMRTTLNLDDALLGAAKRRALETGRTLTAVIEDALRAALGRRPATERERVESLPTYRGGGLQPGVDLDDSGALLELMEQG
jgi:hypothetical protein